MTTLNATMDQMHMGNLASKAEPASKAASTSSKILSQSDTDSDEKLLLDVGNHQSREAFNKLFERFSTKIFAHGMKITRNEQLSKDLVQEAMMTVWQKAPLYNSDRGNVQSWIFTLTRNRCFDMLQAVVEKVYLLNLTHEEAAADLEIPLGTLKSRLRLAMGKLRQLIGTSE